MAASVMITGVAGPQSRPVVAQSRREAERAWSNGEWLAPLLSGGRQSEPKKMVYDSLEHARPADFVFY